MSHISRAGLVAALLTALGVPRQVVLEELLAVKGKHLLHTAGLPSHLLALTSAAVPRAGINGPGGPRGTGRCPRGTGLMCI